MRTACFHLVGLLTFAVLAAIAETPTTEERPPAILGITAQRAYLAFHARDIDALRPMLSAKGVLICYRRAVWPRDEKKEKRRTNNEAFPHTLDDLAPMVWEERTAEFPVDGVQALTTALTRFAKETDGTYHDSVDVSMHQMDPWETRELGPSAAGKTASNAHWFIYFRKEGPNWKIWKLESAIH